MRESALFGTMFGLGAGAVLVGVTVSRLVVGQATDNAAAELPAVAVETVRPAAVEPPPPAAGRSAYKKSHQPFAVDGLLPSSKFQMQAVMSGA